MKVSEAWKAVIAAMGGVVTVLTATVADDVIGLDEVGSISAALGTLVLTVYGVWRVPNKSPE
ncbi:hypothetical protein [Prauserella flavalba]|uniref:hypothetical protein n=1 Tax=Prauserella flavalba TaxID=1477506 RepID=UPI0036E296C1